MNYKSYQEYIIFEKLLNKLKIKLSDNQYQQFFDYYEMLIEKNKVMNLTAITELSEVINKHFVDSLMLADYYELNTQKIIDVGTGAGFPGIPLKIVFPGLSVVLLDSLNKRVNFLNDVIEKLGLNDIKTLHGRAEDYGKAWEYREKFDLCLSRAVAKLSSLSEYCIPYIKVGGHFISYKSGNSEKEIENAFNAINLLGGKFSNIYQFQLPETKIERSLIDIEKIKHTPKAYPRIAGKPIKQPI